MKTGLEAAPAIIEKYLGQIGLPHGKFANFITGLQNCGPTALVGGAVRDWCLGNSPRDLDFMVDCSEDVLEAYIEKSLHPKQYRENQFKGYKIYLAGLEIDVWTLSKTWAFSQPSWIRPATFVSWLETPFFDIDSVVYLLGVGVVLEGGFIKAFKENRLGLLYPANPMPSLCFLKALLHLEKYKLQLSHGLEDHLRNLLNQTTKPVTYQKLDKVHQLIAQASLPVSLLTYLPKDLEDKLLSQRTANGSS